MSRNFYFKIQLKCSIIILLKTSKFIGNTEGCLETFEWLRSQGITIGDTPVDLEEGRNVGCYTFGLTNGSHTVKQLERLSPDGLFDSLTSFLNFLKVEPL